MSERIITLPDVGEGVAEAEIVEVTVNVGDMVREGETLLSVLTDKATVEIPSPAEGRVTWVGPAVGDQVAVGSELVKLAVGDGAAAKRETSDAPEPKTVPPAISASDTKEAGGDDPPPPPSPETWRRREV